MFLTFCCDADIRLSLSDHCCTFCLIVLRFSVQRFVKILSFVFTSLAFFLYVMSLIQLSIVYCLVQKMTSICSPSSLSHFLGKATEHFKTKGVEACFDMVFQIHVFNICAIWFKYLITYLRH